MSKSDLYHKIKVEEVLKDLERLSVEKPEEVKLNSGATLEDISEFEATAGKLLPPDYKTFLQKANGAEISGLEFYCLKNIEHTPFQYLGENDGEVKAPDTYTIASCVMGSQILINLKVPSGARDPNRLDIICRDHEDCIVVAKTFGEFLYQVLRETRKGESACSYWLEEDFEPYRELYATEFED